MIYSDITESFDEHNGALVGYLTDLSGTTLGAQYHYNIRSFHSDHIILPQTMYDMQFWNVQFFQNVTMANITSRVVGGNEYPITQLTLEGYNQGQLDAFNQDQMDNAFVDNEIWTLTASSGTTMTLAQDPTQNYADYLTLTFAGTGVSGTLTSTFTDDILTDFNNPNTQYFIELPLRGFPSQAAALTIDLNNSFIDFTSSSSYDPSQTDSFQLSLSRNDLTNGGDTFFQVDRDRYFNNCNRSNVTGIRLRLTTMGSGTTSFKLANMRIYPFNPLGYNFPALDIDTKRGYYGRSLSQIGTVSGTAPQTLIFNPSKPKNLTQVVKFNTGHPPANLDLYFRYNLNAGLSYIKNTLNIRSGGNSNFIFSEVNNNVTQQTVSGSGFVLNQATAYFLVSDVYDSRFRASIYSVNDIFIGGLVATTGWLTLQNTPTRGYLAWNFNPTNFDTTLAFIGLKNAEFGTFLSKPYKTYSTILGAQLRTNSSPTELFVDNMTFGLVGDASYVTNSGSGPSPIISRTGSFWYGGYSSSTPAFLGNSQQISVSGKIYSALANQGQFRLVLVDPSNSVAWISLFPKLTPNQWTDFDIPIRINNISPKPYTVLIQSIGFYPDTFALREVQLNHLTNSWHATAEGSTFQPFDVDINNDYKALQFRHPGQNLQVKAIAQSDLSESWIESYTVIPVYGTTLNPTDFMI